MALISQLIKTSKGSLGQGKLVLSVINQHGNQLLQDGLVAAIQPHQHRNQQTQAAASKMSVQPEMKLVDLRSDTITKPTPGMRQAMAQAEVGDDVFGEDPTVNELQRRCAELFGTEASLFVPTGTMANLVAIMTHCYERGHEAIVGHKSHILINEVAGISQFAGVMPRTINNKADGTFDLEELQQLIRPRNDVHQPWTKLICLENTQNFCGGKALSMDFIKEVHQIAQANKLAVHTDGSRLLNAAIALDVQPAEIVQYCDSISFCFSKGLGAPVGSVVAGKKDFIDMCRRFRKGLGGGMRQAGVIAAAALYSLDTQYPRLKQDNMEAKQITDAIMAANNGVVDINQAGINTNIITIDIVKPGLTAKQFCDRMLQVTEEEKAALGDSISIKMLPIYPQTARILTHQDASPEMIALATTKLEYVVKEFGWL